MAGWWVHLKNSCTCARTDQSPDRRWYRPGAISSRQLCSPTAGTYHCPDRKCCKIESGTRATTQNRHKNGTIRQRLGSGKRCAFTLHLPESERLTFLVVEAERFADLQRVGVRVAERFLERQHRTERYPLETIYNLTW